MIGVAHDNLPGLLGHELRNPLASALTGSMLLRDMVDDGDPRATVIDSVLRDLDRMTGLIDGWLSVARDRALETERIDVEQLLTAVAARHRAELVSTPPSLTIRANRVLLERAFDNLCENARNAGAQHLRIAAQHDGARVAVHVEDDGDGVAAADVDRVFDAGFSGSGGSGLGLYAVATTIAACEGEVRCVPLENGTRFTVTLPHRESVSA